MGPVRFRHRVLYMLWTTLQTTGGNIQTTNGNITTTNGPISGATIAPTGYLAATGNTRPYAPTATGCYLGCDSAGQYAGLELCAITSAYIDFITANTGWKCRMFLYVFY